MTYLADLAQHPDARDGKALSVGWLDATHPFPTAEPSAELLESLWRYCSLSVARTRGLQPCVFCSTDFVVEEGEGVRLLLGSAEIRVIGPTGELFAAPDLIYHYVLKHHYRPPDEFLRALSDGPQPPTQEYFDRLNAMGVDWRVKEPQQGKLGAFRFVRTPNGVEKQYIDDDSD